MADLNTLFTDFNTFKTDLTTALDRIQADLNKLGGLTPDQQTIVDNVDQGLKDLDAKINNFDVPPAPPTPAP